MPENTSLTFMVNPHLHINSLQARRAARVELLAPIEFPPDLPVVLRREELAQAILENQVIIVCGETGSGKTTQLPKICLSLGRGVQGMIAHTQPRRVAARSVAARIAHELKTEVGGVVGYKVRFNDRVSADTCIKLMTDGILLAEIQGDPQLAKYDTIIIDEAHERSLNIDFLLGYFKQLLPRRPDLKLIITSATLDAERFARHFSPPSPPGRGAGGEGENAPIMQVSGRSYPVEVRYRPMQENAEGSIEDIPQAVCAALDELSITGLRGDVLVFLPGEREIRDTAEALRKHHPRGVEILPLYSRLSAAEQDRVFKTSGMRRIVLATNVAETSLTVPNIGYVIDSGVARINRYSIRQKVEQLRVEKISRAASSQRAGRCGRVMSGVCVRLYDLLINPKKRVYYGPMNVAESRAVFIRQALVTGEFNTLAPFFAHNQKLIQDIEALEHKARRPDVLVDDELIFAFYDALIPPHIHNGAAFEVWRKEAERADAKLLYLKKDDLMRHEATGITTDQFPPQLLMNNIIYALAYNFSPGKNDDGVTLTVPLALINQVSAPRCEYLVPGLLVGKVVQLVKTLPQKLRRHLVPVPEFAAQFCADVTPADIPLAQALARYIREKKQLDVPLDAFRLEQLPAHFLMNFVVVDEHGRTLGMSRNFAQLRSEWTPRTLTPALPPGGREPAPLSLGERGCGRGAGEREQRYISWDLGDFSETTQVQRAGQQVTVFNALHDEGDAVTLRAYDTRDEALAAHRAGLRRLFMLALKEQVKFLEKNLGLQALAMQFLQFGSVQDLQRQILSVTFDRCCLMESWPVNEKEFAARCKEAKSRLTLVAQEIARLAGNVLAEYQAVQKNLPQLKANAQVNQNVRAQLEWLLHREFIARTPYERLQHLPRYLKAINVRLEKLRANPARDARQFAQMQSLQQAWQRKLAVQQGNGDTRVEEFGWLLQELRVSLFAQKLKTPVIVSAKRLQKLWETL